MTATVANFRATPGNFPSPPGNSRPLTRARVTRAHTCAHARVKGNYHSRPGTAGRQVMAGVAFTFGDQLALPAGNSGPSPVDRIRATARARYAAAGTTTERYAAAYDYVRAAAAAARRAGFDPDPEVVELTRAAVAAADRITNAVAGRVS
jgi:hypothetical protein